MFGMYPDQARKPGQGGYLLWLKTGRGKGMATAWKINVEFWALAMLVAGDKLVAAGLQEAVSHQSFELRVYAAGSGEELSKTALDSPPVLDGMGAASGKLFLSCQDGQLRCMGGR